MEDAQKTEKKSAKLEIETGVNKCLRNCEKLWKTSILTKERRRENLEIASIEGYKSFPQENVEKEEERGGFPGLKAPESLKITSPFRCVEKRSRTKKKRQGARQKIKKFFAAGKKSFGGYRMLDYASSASYTEKILQRIIVN